MAKKRARETQQEMFGGQWTQQKLECLQKYLRAYTKILKGNVRARKFLQITYVDAFAGSGYMPQEIPEMPLAQVLPEIADIRAELEKQAEEYKKCVLGPIRYASRVESHQGNCRNQGN